MTALEYAAHVCALVRTRGWMPAGDWRQPTGTGAMALWRLEIPVAEDVELASRLVTDWWPDSEKDARIVTITTAPFVGDALWRGIVAGLDKGAPLPVAVAGHGCAFKCVQARLVGAFQYRKRGTLYRWRTADGLEVVGLAPHGTVREPLGSYGWISGTVKSTGTRRGRFHTALDDGWRWQGGK